MTRLPLSALFAAALTAATLAGPALAAKPKAAPLPDLSAEQIATAERVLTGHIDCEMNQSVDLLPGDKPGYIKLVHKKKTYVLAPEATQSGAVRLENKKLGIVWIQIANKSMLMNSKAGQRMVDGCVHDKQRT